LSDRRKQAADSNNGPPKRTPFAKRYLAFEADALSKILVLSVRMLVARSISDRNNSSLSSAELEFVMNWKKAK